jgi:phosphoserine phosphatase
LSLAASVRDRIIETATPRDERAVAVFDFDNTCILGDIGELYSYWLVEQLAYRYDLEAFWDLIDERDGRHDIRDLVEDLARIDRDDPAWAKVYATYRAEMAAIYPRKLKRDGKASAYEWAVRLHVGLTEDEMHDMSRQCIRREWSRPTGTSVFETDRGERLEVSVGIRPFQEIREVMDQLRAANYEVWVVSATNLWTVTTAAGLCFDIAPDRVLGNRVETTTDGQLTAELVPPALFRDGKVEVIDREIGVRPTIVFGDSETDLSMMEWAELAVLIDHGDEKAGAAAAEHGWAVQPQDALTHVEAP